MSELNKVVIFGLHSLHSFSYIGRILLTRVIHPPSVAVLCRYYPFHLIGMSGILLTQLTHCYTLVHLYRSITFRPIIVIN